MSVTAIWERCGTAEEVRRTALFADTYHAERGGLLACACYCKAHFALTLTTLNGLMFVVDHRKVLLRLR